MFPGSRMDHRDLGHLHDSRDKIAEKNDRDKHDRHEQVQEEEEPEPQPIITRGPSPEPKIEDSECHRSQSAM